jgi:hypothetical protein
MKALSLAFFFVALFTQSNAQEKTDSWLEQLLRKNASSSLLQVLDQPDTFQYQVIYTQITRDKNNQPQLKNFYLHVDRNRYFNPASMVKLPTALLALEKIHTLEKYGVSRNTTMLTDSGYERQTRVWSDSSAQNNLPSVAHYVKKIFLVSDNDAYNRLYEFNGQQRLNQRLWEMGYTDTRITRRFVTMNEDQNRHTNPIRFVEGDKLLYTQPPAYNTLPFDFSKKIFVGRAHYNREDSLINAPMDFTTHNNFPLEDMQRILQSALFPNTVPEKQRFRLTEDDYKFLYRYMSELPSESDYPEYDTAEFFDSYTKFFLFKAGKSKIPPHIRVFNKTGWSYGFLTDVAYIVDFKNNVEFMLSGVIYVNKDGVLNDDKYEYEETGYPFYKEVGNIIYEHELKRKRTYKPDLKKFQIQYTSKEWIRTNLLGYKPGGPKVAIWCSKEQKTIPGFQIVEASTGKKVFEGKAGNAFGAYGPFTQTYRLDFSSFTKPGNYIVRVENTSSPAFRIADDVYKGAADFCLRYMRQQRSFFNPFLKDSCHTHDAYTMYGPMPDSTHIDVAGGWHDASDYLQYSATSANATWHLLAAYRDFPSVFGDRHAANGLPGANGRADILDEAKWGLDWLLKMHPKDDWLFNQIADDRDHQGMRIPKEDNYYGKGYERPVYFCTGQPQGLFKYKNRATGLASTAGKFSSAFALGANIFTDDAAYGSQLRKKAMSAYALGVQKPGVCQTAPGRAPYFYEEDNWSDDMELAIAQIGQLPGRTHPMKDFEIDEAMQYARLEKITPWLGNDTARHYQWYPFVNAGHYELAKQLPGDKKNELTGYYKEGMEKVWRKAKENAFYRGVPFIWCSNNLTTSFAIQCFWYRELTGDRTYEKLEQANFDWLFGCNPWGTSMVYGLPSNGDTPTDPHSAFTHLKNYPIDGGLVDGPVYGSIYKDLLGITLYKPDEYAAFQSDLVVYHDDYGDYSTNEPTMDGTASLIYLLAAKEAGKTANVKKN